MQNIDEMNNEGKIKESEHQLKEVFGIEKWNEKKFVENRQN